MSNARGCNFVGKFKQILASFIHSYSYSLRAP
jgi:hypothetical protein